MISLNYGDILRSKYGLYLHHCFFIFSPYFHHHCSLTISKAKCFRQVINFWWNYWWNVHGISDCSLCSGGTVIRQDFSAEMMKMKTNNILNVACCQAQTPLLNFFSEKTASVNQKFSSLWFRSSHRRYFVKKVFLKMSQFSQESTCVGVFFK